MVYKLAYPICTLMVVLLSFWYLLSKKDMRQRNSKLLLGTLVTELGEVCLQLVSVEIATQPGGGNVLALYIVNIFFYTTHYLVAAMCAFYMLNFYGVGHRLSRKWNILFFVPYVVTCVLPLLMTDSVQSLFTVDSYGFTHTGPAFLIAEVGSLLYFIVLAVEAIRYREELSGMQNAGLALLVVIAAVSSIIDAWIFDSVMVSLFFVAMGILILLIAVDHENWLYSSTTGTYNRMTFQNQFRNYVAEHTEFEVVIVQMSCDVYFQMASHQEYIYKTFMTQVGNYMKKLYEEPSVPPGYLLSGARDISGNDFQGQQMAGNRYG